MQSVSINFAQGEKILEISAALEGFSISIGNSQSYVDIDLTVTEVKSIVEALDRFIDLQTDLLPEEEEDDNEDNEDDGCYYAEDDEDEDFSGKGNKR